jgi:hypothetical protein
MGAHHYANHQPKGGPSRRKATEPCERKNYNRDGFQRDPGTNGKSKDKQEVKGANYAELE